MGQIHGISKGSLILLGNRSDMTHQTNALNTGYYTPADWILTPDTSTTLQAREKTKEVLKQKIT